MDGPALHAKSPRVQMAVLGMVCAKTATVPANPTGQIRIARVLAAQAFASMGIAKIMFVNAKLGGWVPNVPYQHALPILI